MPYKCYTWDTLNLQWKDVNWAWSDCQFVKEIIDEYLGGAIDPNTQLPGWAKDDKDKKRKFIKLLCKVKGYDENETSKQVKDNIKITIEDVQLVLRAVKNRDLKVEEITK